MTAIRTFHRGSSSRFRWPSSQPKVNLAQSVPCTTEGRVCQDVRGLRPQSRPRDCMLDHPRVLFLSIQVVLLRNIGIPQDFAFLRQPLGPKRVGDLPHHSRPASVNIDYMPPLQVDFGRPAVYHTGLRISVAFRCYYSRPVSAAFDQLLSQRIKRNSFSATGLSGKSTSSQS